MPIRSPGDVPGRTVRDLGLPGRAVAALTRAGIASVEDLAVLTRRDLAAINGLGTGMIAAIRRVVPEPPANVRPSAGSPDAALEEQRRPMADPAPGAAEEESPTAPSIPSFASLRAPRRRTPVDLLMPEDPPAPAEPAVDRAAPAPVPRPPDYSDLLRLVRAAAVVPGRVALWSVQEPVRCLRRLLGEQVGPAPAPRPGRG
jgi:hypothetical protein